MMNPALYVFTTIAGHWGSCPERLGYFAETGYSFEDWLNWEAFFACRAAGLKSLPKPEYSATGFKPTKQQADLIVTLDDETKVIVEVGLVHDWTQSKWLDKLDADRVKLAPPRDETFVAMQIIVVATTRDAVLANPDWATWLNRLSFWKEPTDMQMSVDLSPQGTVLIKAWRT